MLQGIERVLVAAGGTAGHLFPAIALAEELSSKGVETLFVCSDRPRERVILKQYRYKFFILKTRPLKKGLFNFFIFIASLISGMLQSGLILLRFRPQVCVGFGSYVSVPLVILAGFLGIRTVIHEQNFVPGKANRVLSNFAGKIAISFEGTKRFFPKKKEIIFTGNPVRSSILNSRQEEAYRFTGFDREKFTVLVIGGSQGSHRINTLFPETISLMDRKFRENLQVIHLTGEADASIVKSLYLQHGIASRVFAFSDNVGLFYRISQLIVARAGASTIAEILAMKVPSLLIPYPYANGHQRLNAKFLEELGASILLEERTLSAETMAKKISELFNNNNLLMEMKDSLQRFSAENSALWLSKEVLDWGY